MIQLFEQSYDVYFSYVAPIHAKERYHIPKHKKLRIERSLHLTSPFFYKG